MPLTYYEIPQNASEAIYESVKNFCSSILRMHQKQSKVLELHVIIKYLKMDVHKKHRDAYPIYHPHPLL